MLQPEIFQSLCQEFREGRIKEGVLGINESTAAFFPLQGIPPPLFHIAIFTNIGYHLVDVLDHLRALYWILDIDHTLSIQELSFSELTVTHNLYRYESDQVSRIAQHFYDRTFHPLNLVLSSYRITRTIHQN